MIFDVYLVRSNFKDTKKIALNFSDFWQQLYSGRAVLVVHFLVSTNHIYVHHFTFLSFEIVFTLVYPIQLCMLPKIWDSTWELVL